MSKPLVSILMTVYNGMPLLKNSIASLLNQSYKNIELVVVDDGSSDDSLVYLNSIKDNRLKVIEGGRLRRAKVLNLGLKNCEGNYIAINDADDISKPDRISKQVDFLETHEEIGLLGTWKEVKNKDGLTIQRMPSKNKDIRQFFTIGQPIQHSTVMFRKELLQTVKGYNEKLKFLLDRDIFLRMAMVTQMEQLEEPLVTIHRSENQFFFNNYKGLNREWMSLKYRVKAINSFGFPKHWIIRELIRSIWSLTPKSIRIPLIHLFKKLWKK